MKLTNQYIETTLGAIKNNQETTPVTIIVEDNNAEVYIQGEQTYKNYTLDEGSMVDDLGYGWTDLDKFLGL